MIIYKQLWDCRAGQDWRNLLTTEREGNSPKNSERKILPPKKLLMGSCPDGPDAQETLCVNYCLGRGMFVVIDSGTLMWEKYCGTGKGL